MKKNGKKRTLLSFIISYILMAILPMMVCVLLFYPQTRRQIYERTQRSMDQEVKNNLKKLDEQINIINSLPNTIRDNNPNLRQILSDDPEKNLTFSNEIKKSIETNTFINDVYVYSRESDYFFSGRHGNIPADRLEQYNGRIGFSFEQWKTSLMLDEVKTLIGSKTRCAQKIQVGEVRYSNMITFLSTIPRNNSYAYATVITFVDGRKLQQCLSGIFNTANDGYIVYNDLNEMVYITNGMDREILAFVDGIIQDQKEEYFIKKDNELFCINRSSSSGWQIAQVQSANSMTRDINMLEKEMVGVMAGLSIFLGGLGYFFISLNYKPLKQLTLSIYQQNQGLRGKYKNTVYGFIGDAITNLQVNNQKLEMNLREAEPKLKRHLFYELLTREYRDEKGRGELLQELEKVGFYTQAKAYRICLFKFSDPSIQLAYLDDYTLNGNLEDYAMSLKDENIIIFMLTEEVVENSMPFYLEQDNEMTGSYSNLKIGRGGAVESILDIKESYIQAYIALDYAIMQEQTGKIVEYDKVPRMEHMHNYPVEMIQRLAYDVRLDKKGEVNQWIQQIKNVISMKELPIYYVKSLFYTTVSIFIDKKDAKDFEIDIQKIFSTDLSSLQMIKTLDYICENYNQLSLDDRTEEKEEVSEAVNYLNENYTESSISLIEMAQQCKISPSYFSVLFKEQTGKTFKEYIDELRLEKAKSLLVDTDKKIESIAFDIGYNSSYSFSRFFKKQTQMAPKEYREIFK